VCLITEVGKNVWGVGQHEPACNGNPRIHDRRGVIAPPGCGRPTGRGNVESGIGTETDEHKTDDPGVGLGPELQGVGNKLLHNSSFLGLSKVLLCRLHEMWTSASSHCP